MRKYTWRTYSALALLEAESAAGFSWERRMQEEAEEAEEEEDDDDVSRWVRNED